MAQKKPVWTTTVAHARLKEYCAAAGRTQLEVVSELILTHLDPANPERALGVSQAGDDSAKPKKAASDQHYGGVWVV